MRNGNYVGGLKWNVIPLYVEIGARGAIHEHSWSWMCHRLGIWGKARQRLRTAVQDTAIYCSHFIFINRFLKIWERKPLLDCEFRCSREPVRIIVDSLHSCCIWYYIPSEAPLGRDSRCGSGVRHDDHPSHDALVQSGKQDYHNISLNIKTLL